MVRELLINWNKYPCGTNSGIYSHYYKRMLKGSVDKDGYIQVCLKCIDGKKRMFKWHRVIYTYFYGTIPEGYEINHLDENKQNNRLSNLSLTSHIENCNYGTRNERFAAKLSKPVVAVDMDDNVVMEFPSTKEAGRQMGFSSGNIAACCRGCYTKQNINYYKGLFWYYLEDYLKMKGVA